MSGNRAPNFRVDIDRVTFERLSTGTIRVIRQVRSKYGLGEIVEIVDEELHLLLRGKLEKRSDFKEIGSGTFMYTGIMGE